MRDPVVENTGRGHRSRYSHQNCMRNVYEAGTAPGLRVGKVAVIHPHRVSGGYVAHFRGFLLAPIRVQLRNWGYPSDLAKFSKIPMSKQPG